jgi:autotransporter-associated beta strand protein
MLGFQSASNLGSGTVAVNGGKLLWDGNNSTDISARLAPIGPNGVTFFLGNPVTFSSALSGSGGITLAAGKLTFATTNGYAGGTTLQYGTLVISSDAALGDVAGKLTFTGTPPTGTGGELETRASFSSARGVSLLGTGNTFNTDAGTTLTWTGAIDGAGDLIKTGTGTMILTGSNSYSGGTTVAAGALAGTASSLQGNITDNATLSFTGSGSFLGNLTGNGTLTIGQNVDLAVARAINSFLGNTIISQGATLEVGVDGANTNIQGTVVNDGTLVLRSSTVLGSVTK